MDAFVQPLYELADFDAIIRQLKKPGIVQVSGCLDSQKAHFTNGLLREFPFRLIVAENDLKAKAFYEDFRLYDPEVLYYPARDLIFYQADIHGNLLTRQRIQVLRALLEREEVTIVTSIDSCLDCLVPLAVWKEKVIKIRNDCEIGVRLLPQFEGKGLAREALLGLMNYAFFELDIDTVLAKCYKENERSRRTLLSAGMKQTGQDDVYYYFKKTAAM